MSTLFITILLLGSYGAGCAIAGALYFWWEIGIKPIAIGGLIIWAISGMGLTFLKYHKKQSGMENEK